MYWSGRGLASADVQGATLDGRPARRLADTRVNSDIRWTLTVGRIESQAIHFSQSREVRAGPRRHGLNVKHVYEAGFSQDGSFTFTQADVFNVPERMADGSPVCDGYVPGGTTGPSDLNFGLTAGGALAAGDPPRANAAA